MPRKMVAPNGEVWNIDDSDVAKAMANGAVDFGSPQHMAMLGTPPPGKGGPRPPDPIRNQPEPQAGDFNPAPITGLAKSVTGTGAGIFNMIPPRMLSPQSRAGLAAMNEYARPANTDESIAKGVGDALQFIAPQAAASRLSELAPVASRTLQARNEAGQFLKGVKVLSKSDLVRRAAIKAGVQATGTGALNAAQGGDFSTGAKASLAASALGVGARAGGPTMTKVIRGLGPGVGAGYTATHMMGGGHLSTGDYLKGLLMASFAAPGLYRAADPLLRVGTAAGLAAFDRPNNDTDAAPVNSRNEYMGGAGHRNVGP